MTSNWRRVLVATAAASWSLCVGALIICVAALIGWSAAWALAWSDAQPDRLDNLAFAGAVLGFLVGVACGSRVVTRRFKALSRRWKWSTPDRVREVARHEAAHAVVAHALGAKVNWAAVEPGGRSDGRTSWSCLDGPSAVTVSLVVGVAPHVLGARERFATEHLSGICGCQADIERAERIARSLSAAGHSGLLDFDGDGGDPLSGAARLADTLLRANSEVVDRVAAALIAHRTIHTRELDDLLSGVEASVIHIAKAAS